MQNAILKAISSAQARGYRPVVLLDLDDTCYRVSPRKRYVYRQLAVEYPQVGGLLGCLARRPWLPYGTRDALALVGIVEQKLTKELDDRFLEIFLDGDAVVHDSLLPEAVTLAQAVVAAGAELVYLSGRPVAMQAGTEARLVADGFPLGGDARVHLRVSGTDEAFKGASAEAFHAEGRAVVAVLDNEPGNICAVRAVAPECVAVLVVSSCSPSRSERAVPADTFAVAGFS